MASAAPQPSWPTARVERVGSGEIHCLSQHSVPYSRLYCLSIRRRHWACTGCNGLAVEQSFHTKLIFSSERGFTRTIRSFQFRSALPIYREGCTLTLGGQSPWGSQLRRCGYDHRNHSRQKGTDVATIEPEASV